MPITCLGQWPNIYQRLENSQSGYLQATQGFVTASRGERLTVLLAVSLNCLCFDQELAKTMFPYFAEVAKTAVLRCSSEIADDGKQSAASSLLGPSRHSEIGRIVKQVVICIGIHLDTRIFVCYLLLCFKIPKQN